MTEQEVLEKLDEVNRNLVRLMAVIAVSGKDLNDQLRALASAGFSSAEIESMTGIPARTIRDRLSKFRKR